MAAKHEDVDKLTKDFDNLEVEESETVTDILKDFRDLLEENKINPHKGIPKMFKQSKGGEKIGIKLVDRAPSEEELGLGNLLQYLIYEYLKEQKFIAEGDYDKYDFYDSDKSFGEAVIKMIPDSVKATTKLLEAELPPNKFKARGRADFYTCGGEGPSILIDFKWTSKDWTDPSPGYALQLLLYQWLAGRRFKEERGAMMYLIRFVEKSTELQLIPFNPPEHLQYSKDSAGVDNYKDIVRLFLMEYYPELLKDSD